MLEKIKALVAENLGVEESKITENSSFKEDLEQIVTVGDVVKYIEAHK